MFWFLKEKEIFKCCRVSLGGHGIPGKVFSTLIMFPFIFDCKNIHEIEISTGYDTAAVN